MRSKFTTTGTSAYHTSDREFESHSCLITFHNKYKFFTKLVDEQLKVKRQELNKKRRSLKLQAALPDILDKECLSARLVT